MRQGMEEQRATAEEVIVTDRALENPWVGETIGGGGVMLDIGCLGSEYLGEMAARADRACGLDIQAVPPVEGVQIVRGDVANPPLKPGSFDVIVSISAVEHIGCAFYGQTPSADGNRYERCSASDIADAGFDLEGFRSDGLVLAELAKGPPNPERARS